MELNKRLELVASFVSENDNIIDVGCDHALLDIYLNDKYPNIKIIASDNKSGPISHAKENIKKYKKENKIIVKLGDGIDTIESDINTIIISGMGGLNMIGILKYKQDMFKQVNKIILSPNNDTDKVRKELKKMGFIIEDEILIKEKNIIYPVIKFIRGKKHYSKIEYIFGPILIKKKDPLFLEYLDKEKELRIKLLELLPKKYISRRFELKKELKEINKIF